MLSNVVWVKSGQLLTLILYTYPILHRRGNSPIAEAAVSFEFEEAIIESNSNLF